MPKSALALLNPSEREVLDIVMRYGPVMRQTLVEMTGLTAMSVSRIARSLGEKSLILDVEKRSGGRGNSFKALSINDQALFSLGVNFTQTAIEFGVLDLGGNLRRYERRPIEKATTGSILQQIEAWLAETAAAQEFALADRLLGIGISLPGDFAADGRSVAANALFQELRGHDLAQEFSTALGYPVAINSDSNCATVGERVLGAGKNYENYLYVHLGHGVGGGLVLGGRAYFGPHRNAGIIGNHFPDDRPRPSGIDLLHTLQAAGHSLADFSDLDGLDPFTIPECREWIRRAGAQLRDKLNYPVKLVDPEAVIIGGRLPSDINQALAVEIDQPDFCITCEMDRFLPRPKVLGSLLGSKAGVIGAAVLPSYEQLFPSHTR